jgi:hypothetical protein
MAALGAARIATLVILLNPDIIFSRVVDFYEEISCKKEVGIGDTSEEIHRE